MNATETKNSLTQEMYAINESLYVLERAVSDLCSPRSAVCLSAHLVPTRQSLETRRAEILAQLAELERKIPAVKWTIVWSESPEIPGTDVEFDGWESFKAAFARIRDAFVAEYGTEAKHYDKTKYRVEFADGQTCTGRVDVNGSEWNPGQCMLDFLGFYAGKNKPDFMTAEEYAAALKKQAEVVVSSMEFLERYDIVA